MMELFNSIFMDEIKDYIKNNMLDDVYDYDKFYDVLFESVTEHINCSQIEMELKKYNYLTIECVLKMCELIKSNFGIDDLPLDHSYIMKSYSQFLVSENGEDLYEYYKDECVNKKIDDEIIMDIDECSICYEDTYLLTTKCNHKFCGDCLFKINNCAICRKQLLENINDGITTEQSDSDDENVILY
jgi:hypothetical protein